MADTIKFGPFTGITNRRKKHALYDAKEKTYALWAATNADVDITGRLSRRSGYSLHTALTSGDSLWSDGANMYYRDSGNLYRDGVSLTSVASRVTYEKFPGGGVIYSDGTALNYISATGVVSRLAPAQSSAVTSLTSTTGTLQPATYIVSVTGVSSDSVEGPASVYETIDLTSTGGVNVTLPALPDGAAGFNVYVSGPNSDILSLSGYTAEGSYTISAYATGRSLQTMNLAAIPAGNIVRIYNGRLLVVTGTAMFISEPYNFGLYDPTSGFMLFPDDVTNVVPMQNGLYVMSDKTYWINGADIRTSEFLEVLPYGAIFGTDTKHDTAEVAYWMSPKGLIAGDISGAVQNLQEEAVALNDAGTSGAILVRSDYSRVVVVTNG